MTRQRELIYSIIMNSCEHLTAYQIFDEARKKMPNIASGTVYRNLDLMVKDGQIGIVNVPNESNRYDKTVKPHHHAICVKCGKTIDIPANYVSNIIEKEMNIQIISSELLIKCVCKDCTNN